MTDIIVEQDPELEQEKKIKARSLKRGRIFLIVINSILGFYFVFFTGQSIYKKVTDVNSDMVTLCGLSASKSTALYNSLFEETYDVGDYYVYGSVLNLSENKIDALSYEPLNGLRLIPVQKNVNNITAKVVKNSTQYFNEGIDLASLTTGDYILSKDSKAIKVLSGSEKQKNVFYTLPKDNGRRNQVTVYSYPKNPCLVINVAEVKELPSNYYDMVVVASSDVYSNVSNLFANYQVKVVEPTATLAEVDSYNSSYVFKIDLDNIVSEKQVTASAFINSTFNHSTITSGNGIGYDENYFIRELGGRYLGGNLKDKLVEHSSDLAAVRNEYSSGKMAFVIEAPTSDGEGLYTKTSNVIDFVKTRRSIV